MDDLKNTIDIEKIASEYKLLLDITSITHKSAKGFLSGFFAEFLKKHSNKLVIPYRLVEDLRKMEAGEEQTKSIKSKKALQLLKSLVREKCAEIVGDKNDPHLNDLFCKLSIDLTYKYDLCLITQNRALVKSIFKLRQDVGVNGKKEFKAFRIKSKTSAEELLAGTVGKQMSLSKYPAKISKPVKTFKLCKKPVNFDKKHYLKVSGIPSINDTVYTKDETGEKTYHRLTKEIGKGGEGSVYSTDTGFACKVYKKSKLTTIKRDKITLMLTNPVDYKGICWPIEMVYNNKGDFVGYLMNKASGKELQKSLFIKPLLFKTFPGWTRLNLLTLCINILRMIKQLHMRNIIIGDINPLNILVKDEHEVYFVDTDSFQIEAYPCPVGTVNYTPPELQGKDYKRTLRTFQHEYFAVSTLVFMILMPGKPPYSKRGGSDPATNIKRTEFSYPYGKDRKKKLPMVHGGSSGATCHAISRMLCLMCSPMVRGKRPMNG